MKLLIDIGNTRTKFALADAGRLYPSQSILHEENAAAKLQNLISDTTKLESIWLSCVGPERVYSKLEHWAEQRFQLGINRVSVAQECLGISNGYRDQAKLGVDRWVAAIGARQRVTSGCLIIIDAGTAVTIDLLDEDDVYQGGVILPGYDLMHQSLTDNTAGIQSDTEPAAQVIGKNTKECVNAGISFGLVGAVERVIMEIKKTKSLPATLLITGGAAQLLIERTDLELIHEPQLMMCGLSAIAGEKV